MPAKVRKRKRTWRSAARSSPRVVGALRRLGARVRALRLEKELSQEAAAERARLDAKHFQTIEAGATNVTVASLVGIAASLGVSLAELFEGV